jgi:prepilin-type N-terminal cleavage/methylation domain-containing protein
MWLSARRPDDRHDSGFTLIELLIAIVVLGVITSALGNAVIGFVKNNGVTADRFALSHDAQISAAYLATDVASVGMRDYIAAPDADGNVRFLPSIQLNAAYDNGKTCGTPATPTAAVRFLSDDWDSAGPTPVLGTDVVAYYLKPTGTVSELHRIKCAGSATPLSDAVLAHYVVPGTLVVLCSSDCAAAPVPQQVTVSFSVSKPSVGTYLISLNGQRRQT